MGFENVQCAQFDLVKQSSEQILFIYWDFSLVSCLLSCKLTTLIRPANKICVFHSFLFFSCMSRCNIINAYKALTNRVRFFAGLMFSCLRVSYCICLLFFLNKPHIQIWEYFLSFASHFLIAFIWFNRIWVNFMSFFLFFSFLVQIVIDRLGFCAYF